MVRRLSARFVGVEMSENEARCGNRPWFTCEIVRYRCAGVVEAILHHRYETRPVVASSSGDAKTYLMAFVICRVYNTELWGQLHLPVGLNKEHITQYPTVLYT